MKTIATIMMACCLAAVSSAATLTWNNNQAASFNGTALKNNEGVTGYLIYLSSGSFASSYSVADSFSAADIGTQVSMKNKTSGYSKISGSFVFTAGDTYDNGDVFGMLLTYNDGSKTYYNLSSATYTMSGAAEADVSTGVPASDPSTASYTFSWSNGTDGTLTAGGGWVAAAAVPEPATGALALAGIALLFKRRKARA